MTVLLFENVAHHARRSHATFEASRESLPTGVDDRIATEIAVHAGALGFQELVGLPENVDGEGRRARVARVRSETFQGIDREEREREAECSQAEVQGVLPFDVEARRKLCVRETEGGTNDARFTVLLQAVQAVMGDVRHVRGPESEPATGLVEPMAHDRR